MYCVDPGFVKGISFFVEVLLLNVSVIMYKHQNIDKSCINHDSCWKSEQYNDLPFFLQLGEMVNLHFLSLMEALHECQSTVLTKLLPLWAPVLYTHHIKVCILWSMLNVSCKYFKYWFHYKDSELQKHRHEYAVCFVLSISAVYTFTVASSAYHY